ncbi:MAG: class I SAM-dependent methyltransferase [Anaerolineae bacterium]|nr:class I SAM-dependent methyltransferase [Anaerolineae bacterium]
MDDVRAVRGCPSYVWRAGQERRFQMVRRWADPAGLRVLDVGCGMGLYTAAFQHSAAFVAGVEVEGERAREARDRASGLAQAVGEHLPFEDASFDLVFSHEVLEHVADDRLAAAEMVRVTRPGGHLVIFVPNRLYPFETHGCYWRGSYHFGNVPLVNYLPAPLRDRFVPHVRAYTARGLRRLFADQPVRILHHTRIYPGYDKLAARSPLLARLLRATTYVLEHTPLRALGLSHFLVLERIANGELGIAN